MDENRAMIFAFPRPMLLAVAVLLLSEQLVVSPARSEDVPKAEVGLIQGRRNDVLVLEHCHKKNHIWAMSDDLTTKRLMSFEPAASGWDCEITKGRRFCYSASNLVVFRNAAGKVLSELSIGEAHAIDDSVVRCRYIGKDRYFVATRSALYIITGAGKQLDKIHVDTYILDAERLPTGDYLYLSQGSGDITHLSAAGKCLGTIKSASCLEGSFSILANGRLLVCCSEKNRVIEIDRTGGIHWQCHVSMPSTAVRLSDGRTLIGSRQKRYLLVVDRDGNSVWKKDTEGEIRRVRVQTLWAE